jgi:hypothetical protein
MVGRAWTGVRTGVGRVYKAGRRWLPWLLLLIVTATAITFGVLWWDYESEARSRDEIEAVSERFVIALTNFSADTIAEDVEEIESFAVGGFADEVERFFGDEAVAAIEEAEATSEGEIEALFVQTVGESSASVFALVSETVTNTSLEEPQTDTLRLEVELIETTSGWRVSSVEVLQAPGGGLLGGSEAS